MTTPVARVIEHQVHVTRRFWRSSLFAFVLSPVLYLSAIGLGLGSLITKHQGDVAGLPYLVFVTPGLMAAAAMQGAANESLWPVMAGMKWVRVYHAMVTTPIRPGDVFVGTVAWVSFRAGLGATVFLVVAAALGGVPSLWGVLAIPAAALCAGAFAAPLTAYAATQETDQRFPVIMRLGILPLFLVSGTFFPLTQLPSVLRLLAWLSPLWHGVEICRAATTGNLGARSVANVLVLGAWIAAGTWWGTRTFSRRLTE